MKHTVNAPNGSTASLILAQLNALTGVVSVAQPDRNILTFHVDGPASLHGEIEGLGCVCICDEDFTLRPNTLQPVSLPKWGLASIVNVWPGSGGTFPVNYEYTAEGAVPVYVADSAINIGLGEFEGRASMIFNPFPGSLNTSHGTQMASIVGGAACGVAKGAIILGAAGFRPDGAPGSVSEMKAALAAVLSHKQSNFPNQTCVCLCAFSATGQFAPDPFEPEINALIAAGVVVVTSSGNDGISDMANSTLKVWPAMNAACFTVAACSLDGGRHDDHNCGTHDIIAPGLDNQSIDHAGQAVTSSGTSNAAAHVAGAAACYIEAGFFDPQSEIIARATMGRAFDFPNGPQGVLFKPGDMASAVAPNQDTLQITAECSVSDILPSGFPIGGNATGQIVLSISWDALPPPSLPTAPSSPSEVIAPALDGGWARDAITADCGFAPDTAIDSLFDGGQNNG